MRSKKWVVGFDFRCLDGTLAAYLLEHYLPRNKTFDGFVFVGLTHPLFQWQLDKLKHEAAPDKELFLVDYSLPPEEAIKLASLYA